jgi:hypothetical protein
VTPGANHMARTSIHRYRDIYVRGKTFENVELRYLETAVISF